jgi:hypothetical protein
MNNTGLLVKPFIIILGNNSLSGFSMEVPITLSNKEMAINHLGGGLMIRIWD